MQLTFIGKKWRLVRTPQRGGTEKSLGDCEGPHVAGKKIRVDPGLVGEKELEVLIHEFLHASDWHRSEEWVTEAAQDIARALWRIGYRLNPEAS